MLRIFATPPPNSYPRRKASSPLPGNGGTRLGAVRLQKLRVCEAREVRTRPRFESVSCHGALALEGFRRLTCADPLCLDAAFDGPTLARGMHEEGICNIILQLNVPANAHNLFSVL